MVSSLVVAAAAAVASALVTKVTIRVVSRLELFDAPGPARVHRRETPTLGGLPVLAVYFAALWLLHTAGDLDLARSQLAGLTVASVVIAALGIYDDTRGCGAWVKLAVQVGAGLLLFAAGFHVKEVTIPFDDALALGLFSLPATLVWVLLVTNAVNLVDGIDGLAAGTVAIGSITLALISLRSGRSATSTFPSALLLGAAVVGFLPFNWPPARIFLGDTGSLSLGFLMAAISLQENRKGTVAVTLLIPIVLLGIPLLDAGIAVVRRLGTGQHPFERDVQHLHHRLLQLGLSQREVTLLLCGATGYLGLTAYLISLLPKQHALLAVVILGVGLALGIKGLEYVERGARRHARREAASNEGGSRSEAEQRSP